MASANDLKSSMSGFHKLDKKDRFKKLAAAGVIGIDDINYLKTGGLQSFSLAEKFIENVIGYFQLPMGVATHFKVDDREYIIPMAVEETSIIAAASKTAKWIRECGKISTSVIGSQVIGQIQIAKVRDFTNLERFLLDHRQEMIDMSNREVASGLVSRGGGVQDIQLRKIDRGDGHFMGVIHVLTDACDAMGANIVNQVCEFLKPMIEEKSGEKVTMCILSNLVDTKLSRAVVELENIDAEQGEKIEEACLFAKLDPYRAATNNKGVLNGIDPILIATGNDWRAVEAGVHAYAARDGQYQSITSWKYDRESKRLTGVFEAPIVCGTVGGVTKLHPTARLSLNMMGIQSASHLGRICAAVGLVQNLGALKALTSVGIIEGHMKLHIKNLTLGAGAEDQEVPHVTKRLEEILNLRKRISLANAIEVLNELRSSERPAELR